MSNTGVMIVEDSAVIREPLTHNIGRDPRLTVAATVASGEPTTREAGGYTIAEDGSSAVVFGMPAEASRMNAVCKALPYSRIAPRIKDRIAIQSGRRT